MMTFFRIPLKMNTTASATNTENSIENAVKSVITTEPVKSEKCVKILSNMIAIADPVNNKKPNRDSAFILNHPV